MNISNRWNQGRNLYAVIFTALAMGMTGATSAQDLVGPDVPVHYADLPIETEQGAMRLLRRIERAAQRVCEPLDAGAMAPNAGTKACRREVTADAVSKVNHPMLLAAYNSAKTVRPRMASLRR